MSFMKSTVTALLACATVAGSVASVQAAEIAVIAGSANDEFFNRVKKGVDQAALVIEANGGKVTYLPTQNYDNFGPDLVGLINTAVGQGVDGIAIPIWVPEAQVPALQAAAGQGVKIMMYNSGAEHREAVKGINYFGADDRIAGVAGGEYLAKNGAQRILCHIHVPGAVNLEARCDGVTEGAEANGAEVVRVPTPANLDSDATGTAEAIKAELLKDSSIDAVITGAAWASDSAAIAIQQAGRPVMLGTFDLSPSVLNRIKDGTQNMAIDQQPYLQSFLAATMLAANIDFGVELATDPVLTGPAIVDAENVEVTMKGVEEGVR
ncbi:substrate-binding domain-containing protein [Paracoccus fistulariae]|uniref:Substrate-binding domain-containing protein n=1 Tax=Paracoccus fistulariae TaxID=658446 RepID=A0ABY7SP46_9RHOB|nr:substrate-binding domain-containing protein [Paracoccus fistulariae]MDB6182255.1 substrate-binding domain-containing protein [Paracoccus fistulariae]WCR08758.1 substrate-binding domain-containing protein [Paracoccus fistulariae]